MTHDFETDLLNDEESAAEFEENQTTYLGMKKKREKHVMFVCLFVFTKKKEKERN